MKITEYPMITAFTADNVLLADGTAGTKQILASDAILAMLDLLSVQNRRQVFRGKSLGSTLTTEQKSAIQNGTFKGLCLGDYWEIGGVKYRIADFDYYYGVGDTNLSSHHLVIVPDSNLGTGAMNGSATTTGGYVGSAMYTTNLAASKSTISSAFSDAVLSHREYLINAVTSGYPSAGAWTDSTVDLMNEPMVFGGHIYTPSGNGTITPKRYTSSPTQLALFRVCPHFINWPDPTGERISYWLRDVVNATSFVRVSSYGAPQDTSASNTTYGIRPYFLIG